MGRRHGRWKAGSDLCELTCSSGWPPWHRCFGVRQDGGDALLIALVSIGAVEAGALMESIMVRAAASRQHLLQRIAILVDFVGKVIALSRSVVPNCTWRARLSHGFLC
jgi:hypothetical protein